MGHYISALFPHNIGGLEETRGVEPSCCRAPVPWGRPGDRVGWGGAGGEVGRLGDQQGVLKKQESSILALWTPMKTTLEPMIAFNPPYYYVLQHNQRPLVFCLDLKYLNC